MSENSKIEWTDHTFNPWEGCQKVGPGCDHCYAETRNARFAGGTAINWGPGAPRRRTSPENWLKPLQWNLRAARARRRDRVFCASLADVFHNAVPDEWREDLGRLISQTVHLDWLLLTKRIGNADGMLVDMFPDGTPDHVWLGATIVNQEEADRDIPKLLDIEAKIHFLSVEPMLGPIDLTRWVDPTGIHCVDYCPDTAYVDTKTTPQYVTRGETVPYCPHCGESASWTGYDKGLDWVICGGESGPGARPMHPNWPRALRDQCKAADVPFLFKQWGEWAPGENAPGPMKRTEQAAWWWSNSWDTRPVTPRESMEMHGDDEPDVWRFGKKASGRHLDGRTHDEFPRS